MSRLVLDEHESLSKIRCLHRTSPARQGNRTALENIRQRLALAYEEGASLKTEKTGALFRAVLTFPLKTVLSE